MKELVRTLKKYKCEIVLILLLVIEIAIIGIVIATLFHLLYGLLFGQGSLFALLSIC